MSSTTVRNRRVVVKVGTAVVVRPRGGLNRPRLRALAGELAGLKRKGYTVVLVSSGAIGAGMDRFGLTLRPTDLSQKQACAAVGQVALMEAYEKAFAPFGVAVAQILLTRLDLDDPERTRNIRHTLSALLNRGVLPVINENDTVATEEIKFGDNDSLAARVAAKIEAKSLFLLTDVEGLLTDLGPGGRVLREVRRVTPQVMALVRRGAGSAKSVGGMESKIAAARLATAAGVEAWIASGHTPGIVRDLLAGRGVGTRFAPGRGVS